jgi:hypothetical protein
MWIVNVFLVIAVLSYLVALWPRICLLLDCLAAWWQERRQPPSCTG